MCPKYTVTYGIASPEATSYHKFVGTGWEFFAEESEAMRCYDRLVAEGKAPTLRPYHAVNDYQHLGAVHKWDDRESNKLETAHAVRTDFEAYIRTLKPTQLFFERLAGNGEYRQPGLQQMWTGWRACAHIDVPDTYFHPI